ncbi:MAG: hypothetical protein GY722_17765 [bacterium]|nr:hypothetical protein [bacterium]
MSVQEISVPFPEEPSVFREVEDAVLDNQGNLLVYNRDTAVNYLSILNVANGTWEHHLVPSTGTGGNSTYGDMGRLGQRLFIPGYRIDLTNFSSTSFVLNQPPGGTGPFRVATTCTIGRDGLLYALSNVFPSHWLYVLDPETLATLQLFDLRNSAFQTLDVRGVDVNENGEIFGITNAGILYHFGADGRYLNESFVEPSFGGIDVALDDEMNLAVTGTSNRVAVTDESFAIPTTFFGEVRPHLVYVRAAGPACLDLDMDGYGDPANPECPHAAEDCDDQDDTVNPGETEGLTGDPTCLDGKDNDCDGLIDDLDPDCTTLIGLEAQLVADEPVFGAEYGFAVGATRDLAVVGAPEQDGNVGTAYVFARTDGV